MQEIRFSPPKEIEKQTVAQHTDSGNSTGNRGNSFLLKLVKLLLLVAILCGVALSAKYYFDMQKRDPLQYSAVFLVNGQVYFGKIKYNNSHEMLLTDVYYLELNQDGSTPNSVADNHFSLIKLGSELHGPTNEMYINKNQIVFYENLRKDSKLVESISGMK